jgi:integrase
MMSTWFRQAVKERSALDDVTLRTISFHGSRHTCATLMLKSGQPVHVVSRFLGDASVQITLDYCAHVMPGQDESAVVALVAMYS